MRKVWIAQCLCPNRHTILAAAGEADDREDAEETLTRPLRENIASMLAERVFNPWCGMCKARDETWIYDLERTAFATMDEAMPHLRQSEAEQAAIRALFGDGGTRH